MGFKTEDVLMMQRRLARSKSSGPSESGTMVPFSGVEAGEEVDQLHRPAVRWLQAHNIAYVWSRTDKPSTVTEGAPDFVIAVNPPVFVEFKTKVGKLSEKQRDWHFLAERAGVKVHVLRSLGEFLALMKESGIE